MRKRCWLTKRRVQNPADIAITNTGRETAAATIESTVIFPADAKIITVTMFDKMNTRLMVARKIS